MRTTRTSRTPRAALLLACALAAIPGAACAPDRATAPAESPRLALEASALRGFYVVAPRDTVVVGGSMQLQAIWYEASGTYADPNAFWEISNTSAGRLSATGVFTGVVSGQATLRATTWGTRAYRPIHVVAAPPSPEGAPAPSPSPSPSPSPAPNVPPPPSAKTLVGDAFTSYASTAAFLANVGVGRYYNDGSNQALAAIDPNVRYDGHQTLRYDLPAGTANVPQLWPALPTRLGDVWLRVVLRYSPGFTTAGTSGAGVSNSYKLFGLGFGNVYGTTRFEVTNTTQYYLYAAVLDGSISYDAAPGGSISTEWSDGGWYDYYLHYQVLSPSQIRTRVFRARVGQTPVLVATIANTVKAGSPAPLIGFVQLGLNFNQVRSKSESLWYGMWEAVDGSRYPNPYAIPGA